MFLQLALCGGSAIMPQLCQQHAVLWRFSGSLTKIVAWKGKLRLQMWWKEVNWISIDQRRYAQNKRQVGDWWSGACITRAMLIFTSQPCCSLPVIYLAKFVKNDVRENHLILEVIGCILQIVFAVTHTYTHTHTHTIFSRHLDNQHMSIVLKG